MKWTVLSPLPGLKISAQLTFGRCSAAWTGDGGLQLQLNLFVWQHKFNHGWTRMDKNLQ
jgi:hypothetical protein